MPVAPELLYAARKYHTSAATSLLESYYPLAHRLAHALCGDETVAGGVIRQVMTRALKVLPRWRDETLPDRWFYHHTVLATRAAPPRREASSTDPLIPPVAAAHYVAFVRTLRSLPPQQREAIVLHFGERLNPRFLGIAMDCSADAATAHLQAALDSLKRMTGESFEGLAREFAQAYRALAPSPPAVAGLRGRVARFVWPRLVRRWVIRAATAAGLLAAGGIGWRYRHALRWPW